MQIIKKNDVQEESECGGTRLVQMVQPQVWVHADGMDEDLQLKQRNSVTDGHDQENLLWLSLSWLLGWSLG